MIVQVCHIYERFFYSYLNAANHSLVTVSVRIKKCAGAAGLGKSEMHPHMLRTLAGFPSQTGAHTLG
jgi:hypothetical protein